MRTPDAKRIMVPAAAIVVAIAIGFLSNRTFLVAWLSAFAFLVFAALGVLMLDCMLTLGRARLAGSWRAVTARAAAAIAVSPIGYLPLAIGLHRLYAWSSPAFAAQSWYLDPPFAYVRAFVYFAAWIAAARFVVSRRAGASKTALALLALFLAANLAAVDWMMALTPAWHSSDFGLRWCVNGLLTGASAAAAWLSRTENGTGEGEIRNRIDGATMMFALNLGWIYLMFVDYITAWSGNLPDEAGWYVVRIQGIWLPVIVAAVACHLVVGVALLFRGVKRSAAAMPWIAAIVVAAQWLETVWTIAPHADGGGAIAFAFAALTTCALACVFVFAPIRVRRTEARSHG